jgi:mannosyl-3-phosphoglycerate phosphatase
VKPVIFTDLDGTLLDPVDYSYEAASEALEIIKRKKIPLVFTSSKTGAEIEYLRQRLSNTDPFISENGGAVFIPEGYFPFPTEGEKTDGLRVITLGSPVSEVRKALEEIKHSTGAKIKGFGEMGAEEVALLSGLSVVEAGLCKEREFDEPFIIDGDEPVKQEVLGLIEKTGFSWTRGRFFHILGSHDKGRAVRILKDLFTSFYGKIATIGLGDNLNDVLFLEECDHPVLVMKPGGGHEPAEMPGLIRAEGVGPIGWNSAVLRILEGFR